MTGSVEILALAMALFVTTHLLAAAPPVRAPLVARLGEPAFRLLYSGVSLALLSWAVRAYNEAPRIDLWIPSKGVQHLALPLMLVACVLVVAGLLTPNPSLVGSERAACSEPAGILKVTRHPMLWGFGLWGIAHLLANGDAAGLILFGGLTILSFAGAAALDAKKRALSGAVWEAYGARTSFIPFAALIAGRTRLHWRELGWSRIGVGIVLYALLVWAHRPLFGVSPLPL